MAKYINADKLRYEIERRNLSDYYTTTERYEEKLYEIIDSLEQDEKSEERWQPCDEHFRALGYVIEYFKKKKNDTTYLEDLYNGLKKLF